MSTEEGHQSRGGLKRHTKLRRGSVAHGAKAAPTTEFIHAERSAKQSVEAQWREDWRNAMARRGELTGRVRVTNDWLESLNPLVRENAELLLRQHMADICANDRSVAAYDVPGFDTEDEFEDDVNYGGWLHGVCFDRPDDAWPFYAARGRLIRGRAPKPVVRRKRDES